MDAESLRKQITGEVHAEFEIQLREMKREKSRVEEELESASDRWRAERRRLNSEIDRLEDALAAKKPSAEKSGQVQQALEEKLRQAATEWNAERERLTSEVSRLQAAVAEAIARSSNPIRATQTIRDQFEVKLADVKVQHLEAERELLRAKVAWDEDKKKLMDELISLRRLAPSSASHLMDAPGRLRSGGASVEDARIRELEGQLGEARATILKYHEATIRSAQELTEARKDIQRLNEGLSEIREQIGPEGLDQLRRGNDAKVQDLIQQNNRLVQELEDMTDTPGPGEDPSAAGTPSAALNAASSIRAEVERIEGAIAAIEKLFDDPDTTASTIAQKSIEKAELEAYLRGIRFQNGRVKGS